MEKGGGDWGRVMAESKGEWTGEEWTGIVRRWVWKM